MNTLSKIGGLGAILFGASFLVAIILLTPPFLAAAPEVMEAGNVEARLRFAASLGQAQTLMLALGSYVETLAPVFLIPALLGLHSALGKVGQPHALIGTGFGALAGPFFVIQHLPRFSLLALGARYAVADAAERIGLVATYRYAENLSLIAEQVFWFFLAFAVLFYGLAMKHSQFPRWINLFSFVVAGVAILGVVGAAISEPLGILMLFSGILSIVWFVGVGAYLYRTSPERSEV